MTQNKDTMREEIWRCDGCGNKTYTQKYYGEGLSCCPERNAVKYTKADRAPVQDDGEAFHAFDRLNCNLLGFVDGYETAEEDYTIVRTALQNQRKAVDVDGLKKWTDDDGYAVTNMYQSGWNACLDHLKEQGIL